MLANLASRWCSLRKAPIPSIFRNLSRSSDDASNEPADKLFEHFDLGSRKSIHGGFEATHSGPIGF